VVGARSGVRSENSILTISGSRFDSTLTGVIATGADSLTLQDDTVNVTLQGSCVVATSASAVTLISSRFWTCTPGVAAAVSVTGGILRVQQSTFTSNRAAVVFSGASFTASGNIVSGSAFTPRPGDTVVARAALDANAALITVTQNTISGHAFNAGVRVEGGASSARVDSNFISTNNVGLRLGSLSNFSAQANDLFDNLTEGVLNETGTAASMSPNWWGDPRGPRGLADPAATGDSVAGAVAVPSWNSGPLASGSTGSSLRSIRGDGQTGVHGVALAKAFTVRVIDATGRPVAGVQVTFKVTGGGGNFAGSNQVKVNTNSSGLAEATLTLGTNPGTNIVTATAAGITLTFRATGT
jgi:hypothetical protein